MRVSDISRWTQCEAWALTSGEPPQSHQHAATLVGSLAHAELAGVDITPPAAIRWDAITRTMEHAQIQARAIAIEARRIIHKHGLTIIAQEEAVEGDGYTGHLDLRCWSESLGETIVDLKTGAMPGAAWLQVGGYCAASPVVVNYGGVLHVPRVAINRDVRGTLETRLAHDLVVEWARYRERIAAVLEGAPPLSAPGMHCRYCPLTHCVVRAS